MANYSTTNDLLPYRPDIINYDNSNFAIYHTQAKTDIDRRIEMDWYRQEAENRDIDWTETAFDADLMLNASTQLKQAAIYLALYYIYAGLTIKVDDYFQSMRNYYEQKYENEISLALSRGIDYDWDESGTIEADETADTARRRLYRG